MIENNVIENNVIENNVIEDYLHDANETEDNESDHNKSDHNESDQNKTGYTHIRPAEQVKEFSENFKKIDIKKEIDIFNENLIKEHDKIEKHRKAYNNYQNDLSLDLQDQINAYNTFLKESNIKDMSIDTEDEVMELIIELVSRIVFLEQKEALRNNEKIVSDSSPICYSRI